ncbi:serpin family protein [Parabacteroides sp. FAFU027]|uniref:serpin family protein n=1 Tax=Parabacteroides sp. FAFU027 TaxID=2922715 RepID=UPI001FAED331|nr:serpin family protein [Parabacteroides sp. FAFU027]
MKKILFLTILLITGLHLQSCDKNSNKSNPTPNIREMRAGEKAVISSSNRFCFDYFKLLSAAKKDTNVTFSPISAHAALSMLINGADGTTKQEIKDALRISTMSDPEINESFKSLKEYLLQVDNSVTLNIANSVWARLELHIKSSFANTLRNFYSAEVQSLDFSGTGAVKTINNWVSNQTKGKIPTIIDDQKIASDVVMYLLNAVYFKSDWKTKFDKAKTQKAGFTKDDGSVIQVDMMQSEKMEAWMYYDNSVQFIDIPFGNGGYSFTVIMPNGAKTLDEFIGEFDNDKLQTILAKEPAASSEPRYVSLKMPKFNFSFNRDMNDLLKTMGMKRAFTDTAELPSLFEEQLPLSVSKVKQKTFVQIDENGGEAAAVTSVEITVTSVGPGFITVDRPFLFLIREKNSNTILFIGKVHHPVFQ